MAQIFLIALDRGRGEVSLDPQECHIGVKSVEIWAHRLVLGLGARLWR